LLNTLKWLVRLKLHKIQVIHLNYVSWGPSLAFAAKLLGIPIAARAGGEYSKRNYSCRWINKYFAICKSQAAELLNSPNKNKVSIVGNFVNRTRIEESGGLQSPIVPKVSDHIRFLFLGQLEKRKGIHVLVNAFANMTTDADLLLVGGDWALDGYPEEIKSLIQQHGIAEKIHLYNHRLDIVELLRQCDVFVLPTIADTMPRVILEAMCIGKCIISTTVGGIPELIIDNETGRLVPPNDIDALTMVLDELANSKELRDKFEKNARAWAETNIDPYHTAENYVDGYRELVV